MDDPTPTVEDAPSNPMSPTTSGNSPSQPASVEDNVDDSSLNQSGEGDSGTSSEGSGASSHNDDENRDEDEESEDGSEDDDEDDDDDDNDTSSNPDADDFAANRARSQPSTSHNGSQSRIYKQPSFYAQSSRSNTHLPSHGLFPPFYNRPPTPLPPSPSLTSLLRPSFSTTTSRPTTPDTSDGETGSGSGVGLFAGRANTNRSVASHRTGDTRASISTLGGAEENPVPPTTPRVPTYESYGFAVYLFSGLAFLMYMLWAYLPSPFLHSLGIRYYPNRWWALAIPAWLVVLIVWIYVALASYNTGYLTLDMDNIEVLVDEMGRVAGMDDAKATSSRDRSEDRETSKRDIDWKSVWSKGTDGVLDIPIGGVCEILYGLDRDPKSERNEG